MKKIDWNGPDFEYLVRYRFDDEFSPWKQIVIEDPLAVSCTKCFLHFFYNSQYYYSFIFFI